MVSRPSVSVSFVMIGECRALGEEQNPPKLSNFTFFVKFRTDFHDTFPCFKCMSERFRCICAQNYEKRKVPCLYSPTTPTFDVSSSSSLQWLAPLIDRTCSFALIFINNLRFICRQPDRGSHSPNIRKMTKNSIATF